MDCEKGLLVKYYRLSLDDQKPGESDSITNQRSLIDDYVKNHEDLERMEKIELSDDGYTGMNFNRPGIKRLFKLLRSNKVGCLIVKDFSRFSRDYIELGNYIEQIFPFMEVRFISVNDAYDSITGESVNSLEVPFKGLLNDLYSRDISMKVKAAKRQMIKQGKLCSGSYPFGYIKVEKTDRNKNEACFLVDEDAAGIIRYIFKLALEGKCNIEIARILNEKKYPTPGVYKRMKGGFGYGLKEYQKSIWDSAKVLIVLRDERYKGTLVIGRYQSAGIGSGKIEQAPKELWYRKEDAIPPIIEKESFEAVQTLRPYKERGKYRKEHHLLYRKVKCGCCGKYLYFKPSESGAQYHSFFCKQSHLNPESKCFRGYVKEAEILKVLQCLIEKQTEIAGNLKREVKKRTGSERYRFEQQLRTLKREIEVRQADKAQHYIEYREGGLTREAFIELKEELQNEITEREAKVSLLENEIRIQADGNEFVKNIDGYQKVERLNRGMIEKLVDTVWIYDVGRVKVDLKFGIKHEIFYSLS